MEVPKQLARLTVTHLLTFTVRTERIGELLKSRGYNPHPSQQDMGTERRKKPAYHITAEVAGNFQGVFHVEEGLYVFNPLAAAFLDFRRFLKDVEEIAGRKMGVVKIIVSEWWVSFNLCPSGI